MFKVYSFVRRNPALTQGEFVNYFTNVHAPLCTDLWPSMSHCNGNFAVGVEAVPNFKRAPFDAMINQGFDIVETMHAALNGPAFAIPKRVASRERFMNMTQRQLLVVEEFKVLGLSRPGPRASRAMAEIPN